MVSTSSISAVGLVNQHGLNWKADSSLFNLNYLSLIISGRNREFESRKFHIRALMAYPDIDFADPKWKNKFQESFDRRFDLPHLRDSLEMKPRSTTFSLKSRVPLVDGNGAPEDTWNGYVNDDDRALLKVIKFASPSSAGADCIDPDCSWVEQWVHRAGPRKLIYYEPDDVKAAIVTCGGLCPGLNDVIRQARGIDILFILGGNGTHAGANAIHNECRKRSMKVSVIAVPKTIDNDIPLMDKTFGFDTAVEEAQRAINSAYIEAHSAYHGIGLVKLMGRSSGFIAMHASVSSGQIDVCLIPEVPFTLEGPHGVLQHLEHLIRTKGSAVVCIAEGAGQDLLQKSYTTDASGNVVLSDIGVHIQQQIRRYFKEADFPADVKYIDPTYMIRACRANASGAILCTVLGQNARLRLTLKL